MIKSSHLIWFGFLMLLLTEMVGIPRDHWHVYLRAKTTNTHNFHHISQGSVYSLPALPSRSRSVRGEISENPYRE